MSALGAIGTSGYLYASNAQGIVYDIAAAKNITTISPPFVAYGPNIGLLPAAYFGERKKYVGVVKSSSGIGIARTLIAWNQGRNVFAGSTVSDASGNFTMRVPSAELITIFEKSLLSDARNGVILEHLTPVNP